MDPVKARKLFGKYRREFEDIFGVPLEDFWDIRTPIGVATGFDLIRFDTEVVKSGNKRMDKLIAQKYGEGAALMIEILINA